MSVDPDTLRPCPHQKAPRPGRSWTPTRIVSLAETSSMSAAASSGRSRAGGAGRVTGSTGPGAPCTLGPACSPMLRPSVSRLCSLMIATLRSRPPGASTSARFQAYGVDDSGLGKYLMQRLIKLPEAGHPRRAGRDPDPGKDPDQPQPGHSGLLRPAPYLQRPTPGDQRAPGAPTRHRPGTCATWPTTPSAASSTPDASKTT